MTARWAYVFASIASLVLACNKQQAPDTASPRADGDVDGAVAAKDERDPAAQLADYEAQLVARKAELAAHGVALRSSTTSSPPPAITEGAADRDAPAEALRTESSPAKKSDAKNRVKKKKKKKKKPRRIVRKQGTKENAASATSGESDACAPICRPADAI